MKTQLHVISDGKQSINEFIKIAKIINPYVDKFHFREKQKAALEIFEGIQSLIEYGIPSSKIIVNDRIDVACALQIGVHLAFHSLPLEIVKRNFPNLQVGCSVHSYDGAKSSESRGADYLLYGHVFETNSKKGIQPRGLEELEAIKKAVSIPVLAIGGIKPENVEYVLKTKVDGIAVMSGILKAKDPLQVVMQYREQLSIGGGSNG